MDAIIVTLSSKAILKPFASHVLLFRLYYSAIIFSFTDTHDTNRDTATITLTHMLEA